jgi:hypothetical protein
MISVEKQKCSLEAHEESPLGGIWNRENAFESAVRRLKQLSFPSASHQRLNLKKRRVTIQTSMKRSRGCELESLEDLHQRSPSPSAHGRDGQAFVR